MRARATPQNLILSIVIDLLSMFQVPNTLIALGFGPVGYFLTEFLTVGFIAWAYPNRKVMQAIGAIEEILWFDLVPSATIAWFIEYFRRD